MFNKNSTKSLVENMENTSKLILNVPEMNWGLRILRLDGWTLLNRPPLVLGWKLVYMDVWRRKNGVGGGWDSLPWTLGVAHIYKAKHPPGRRARAFSSQNRAFSLYPGVFFSNRAFSSQTGRFHWTGQRSSNGHNFFYGTPIEACKIPTWSSFEDEENGMN